MKFLSDNVSGVSPEIMAALAAVSRGEITPCSDDECRQRLSERFSELFESDVVVFPVVTGSAANALALSAMTPPFGAVYCHAESHINMDECGGPEFYTNGAKLVPLQSPNGKIRAADLTAALEKAVTKIKHGVQPAAVSIAQVTEAGTVYRPHEIAHIAEVTHTHGLNLHMDGARFANAIVSLDRTPADITWRVGVDVLSFGATKNGAMAADAVVFFKKSLAETFSYHCKRGGHLLTKPWFLSVQLETYVTDNLWLKNATHANQMAAKLASGLEQLPGIKLCYPVEANEVFVEMPESVIQGLFADGFQFYRPAGENSNIIRLVTSFNSQESNIDALLASARHHVST